MRWITIVLIFVLGCRMKKSTGRPTEEIDQANPAENDPKSETEQAAETVDEETGTEVEQEEEQEQEERYERIQPNGRAAREAEASEEREETTLDESVQEQVNEQPDSEESKANDAEANTESQSESDNGEQPVPESAAEDKQTDSEQDDKPTSPEPSAGRLEGNDDEIEPDELKSTEATEQSESTENSAVENTQEPNSLESVTASEKPDDEDDSDTKALLRGEDARSEKAENSDEEVEELTRSNETTVAPSSPTSTAEAETPISLATTSHSSDSDEQEQITTSTPISETEGLTSSTEASIVESASKTKLLHENQTDGVTTREPMQEPTTNHLTTSHESPTSTESLHTASSPPSHDDEPMRVTTEETRVRELDDVDSIDQTAPFKSFEFDMPVFNDSIYQDLMMNESEWMKELSLLGSLDDEYVVHDACNFISENIQKMFGINVTKEQVHDSLPSFRFLFEADTEELTTIKDMLLSCVEATSQKNNTTTNSGCNQIKSLIIKTCTATDRCRGGEHNLLLQTMERIREVINTNHLNDALLMLRACATQSYE